MRGAAGFYDPESRKAVVSGRGEADTHRTAVRESSHAVLMHAVPRVPPWLNEGLAEYFETVELLPGVARVPIDPRRHAFLARHVEAGGGFRLPVLFAISPRDWHGLSPRASHLAYTQSWSLVAFWMETPEGRERLRAVLAAVARGGSASDAVERHHPGGVARLEQDWRGWLARTPRSHRY